MGLVLMRVIERRQSMEEFSSVLFTFGWYSLVRVNRYIYFICISSL